MDIAQHIEEHALLGVNGNINYMPPVSQYCIGAWQGRIRGQNLVPDLSRNQAQLHYINATADTDVLYAKPGLYDTFTSGSAYNKGLLLHNTKVNGGAGWDLNAGDSLLVMFNAIPISFKTFTPVAGSNTGNGTLSNFKGLPARPGMAGTVAGAYIVTFTSATSYSVADPSGAIVGYGDVGIQYQGGGFSFLATAGGTAWVSGDKFTVTVSAATGCTVIGNNGGSGDTAGKGFSLSVSAAGVWTLSITVGTNSTQAITVTPNAPLSPTAFTTLPETFYNGFVYVDGLTKRAYFSLNGEYGYTNVNALIMPDSTGSYSTVNATPYNWGLGFSGGASNGSSVASANPVTFQSLQVYVIPGSSGQRITNPKRIEKLFNADPMRLFSGFDLFGQHVPSFPAPFARRLIAVICGAAYNQSNELGSGCTMAAIVAATAATVTKRPTVWGTFQEVMTSAASGKASGVFDLLAEKLALEYGATVAYENWAVGGTSVVMQWCGFVKAYAASTAYAIGDWVMPGNGWKYKCSTAGTSGSSAPTWGTPTAPYSGTATFGQTAFNAGFSVTSSSVVQVNNIIWTSGWSASGTTITFTAATGASGSSVQVGDTVTIHAAPVTDGTAKWVAYPADANDSVGHVYAKGESGYDPNGNINRGRKAVNRWLSAGYEVWIPAAGHQNDLIAIGSGIITYANMLQAMKNIITDVMSNSATVNGHVNTVKYLLLGVTPRYYQSTFDTSTAYNTQGNAGAWAAGGFLQNLNGDLTTWMNTNWPGVAKPGGDLSGLTNQDFFVGTSSTGDLMIHQNAVGIDKQAEVWWSAVKNL